MKQIKTVAIIGVGLIGGSIGMALKKRTKIRVIGIGRHRHKLLKALKLGAVDEITTDFCLGVKSADLVVIATPVDVIGLTVKKVLGCLKKGCIITDVGSVKGTVVKEMERIISKRCLFFIGGHPMAGSEQKGVDVARNNLFNNAVCILTPSGKSSSEAVRIVQDIWQKAGAKVIKMSPARHDEIVSCTSHLPHILASSLVDLVHKLDKKDENVSLLTAGSFRDLTRVASSDPMLWTEICLNNRTSILSAIKQFSLILKQIETAINQNNRVKLLKSFSDSKKVRDNIFSKRQKGS